MGSRNEEAPCFSAVAYCQLSYLRCLESCHGANYQQYTTTAEVARRDDLTVSAVC